MVLDFGIGLPTLSQKRIVMSDNYQAVYDAVRSVARAAFSGFTAYDAVREVVSEAFSGIGAKLHEEICIVGAELVRPSRSMRPRVFLDGNQWCALYGINLQDGVVGFGDSPELACVSFDSEWRRTCNALT